MDLKSLQYFVTVAEEGTFSKAAQKLYVSQPALSICIRRLEKELNAELFIRTKNKLTLTSIGKLFLEEGGNLLQMNRNLLERINDAIHFEQGFIQVGISQFYGRYYAPQLFYAFKQSYPGIGFEIIEDFSKHLEELVIDGSLDLCCMPSPIISDSIEGISLFQEQILFAVSKKRNLHKTNQSNFSDGLPIIDITLAKNLPFVMLKKHQKTRVISEQICEEAGFIPNIVVEAQDLDTVNNFIALDMGVGFVPDIIARESRFKNMVDYYQIKSNKTTRAFMIAFNKGASLSKSCKSFIQLAVNIFRENRGKSFA